MPPPPTTTTPDPRLGRALAFERAMHAAFGRAVTTRWGQAFLRPDLFRYHDGNLLWGAGDAGGLEAEALDAEAERLLGGAGLPYRRIFLEEPAESRLAPALAQLGYQAAHHVFMAHAGPAPGRPRAPVRETDVEHVLPGMDRYLLTDPDMPYGREDLCRAHLLEHSRTYGASVRERAFVVDHDGAPVAWALLWTHDGVAQVDEVVCLAEHRGRGYGRAVVAEATRVALAEAPELLFLVADAGDWPQHLYGRLGYEPIGQLGIHHRPVPVPAPSAGARS
jgi:GNAT superfamily N-acetyltransferase